MARRVLLFLCVAFLVVGGAVWLADRPGTVTVHWNGWRLDTTMPVLLVTLVLAVAAIEVAWRLIHAVITGPRRLRERRRAKRTRDGYLALSDGLAAVATGDHRAARKLAQRADKLLADHSLTSLLSARAAELAGDAGEAERRLSGMLERPETAFLGLKGLMDRALASGDRAAALDYARRAWGSSPTPSEDLAIALFDLQARAGQWSEAQLTLADAKRRGALSGAALLRRQAIVLNERAAAAEAAGDIAEAASLALEAHRADPALSAAGARAATLLHRLGKNRKAAAIIEEAWRAAPDPALVAAWTSLSPAEAPLARVKRMERLLRAAPAAADGHLGLAEAAMAARLWGQARNHLTLAAADRPAAAWQALAEVERQAGDPAAAAACAAKAAAAPLDPGWVCSCGARADSWRALCPGCGGVDTLKRGGR